jgi:hypothetical protein
MRYIHGIPVVNRPDLLELAVGSIEPLWPQAFILDNSPEGWIGASRVWAVPVVRPSVPLSVAQSMNFLHRLAREAGADVFFFQHSDAQAGCGSAARFVEAVTALWEGGEKWAAALTHYDALAAFSVAAVDDVGPWDTSFPQPNYHIDNDWLRRARLKGYLIVPTGVPVTHHNDASSTLKSSAGRRRVNDLTFPMNNEYYRHKWGGLPDHEVYMRPWNDDDGTATQH